MLHAWAWAWPDRARRCPAKHGVSLTEYAYYYYADKTSSCSLWKIFLFHFGSEFFTICSIVEMKHRIDNSSVVTVVANWQHQGKSIYIPRWLVFLWFWLKPGYLIARLVHIMRGCAESSHPTSNLGETFGLHLVVNSSVTKPFLVRCFRRPTPTNLSSRVISRKMPYDFIPDQLNSVRVWINQDFFTSHVRVAHFFHLIILVTISNVHQYTHLIM
jgi:hypothetical protein